MSDYDGEELCPRIDALDAAQARAALRYLALGIGSSGSADAAELARAIRHGETFHETFDAVVGLIKTIRAAPRWRG